MPFSDIALKILEKRYYLKDKNGTLLEHSPEEVFRRVSKFISSAEEKYEHKDKDRIEEIFYKVMINQELMPASPILFNAGTENSMLSSCFGMEIEDSMDSILKILTDSAKIFKLGGGCGWSFSKLRPKNSVLSSGGTSSGVCSFISLYDMMIETIKQGGKRRGAGAGILDATHPDIIDFIKFKRNGGWKNLNISVVCTNDFMSKIDTEYKYIWEEIIESNWQEGDPNVIFIDTMNKNNSLPKYPISIVNPCFSGDTLVAVADGRNYVSMKQLVEEGKDIPVYSLNKKDRMVEIKMGRNPRVTGSNKKLIRVTLDDLSYLDVTENHKFILNNGKEIEAKNLKTGDSLPRFSKYLSTIKDDGKYYYRVRCDVDNPKKTQIFEHRLVGKFHYPELWNELCGSNKKQGFTNTNGIVAHHIDGDRLNNSPNNLKLMSTLEHSIFHASENSKGELNIKYSGVSFDELKKHGLNLTKKLGRRFSVKEWQKYADSKKIPKSFSEYRKNVLGDVVTFSKLCASELRLEYINCDPRAVKTYQNMLSMGYDTRIKNNVVLVKKICKSCSKEFEIDHNHRENITCSLSCWQKIFSSDENINEKRKKTKDIKNIENSKNNKYNQSRIYNSLKFKTGRVPLKKEWEKECKTEGVPYRVGNILKYGFKTYEEVKREVYNHKVLKLEILEGEHKVYNITIDDNNTVAIITKINSKKENEWFSGVFTLQCHEIAMSSYESCNLAGINLDKCVKGNKENIKTDWDKLGKLVKLGHRFLDDMIDVNNYPLPEIKDFALKTRRQGLYVFGLAPALLRLGLRYGSQESLDYIDNLFNFISRVSLESCIKLGKIRGDFPEFKDSTYYRKYKHMRCSHRLTIAPSGTTSRIADSYFSIEPYYAFDYVSNIMDDSIEETISLKKEYQDLYPEAIVTAYDITPEEHIAVMSTIQKYIDQSISKTINVPNSATKEDIDKIFRLAFISNLKCITAFRDGCKGGQVLEIRKQPMECKNGVCEI